MSLREELDRLANFEPSEFPVISLYLNAQADQHGRDNFWPFVKKSLNERAKTYPLRSEERRSFDTDTTRIQDFLKKEVDPAANCIAIFACAGANGFFKTVQVDAPIDENLLYVGSEPHLYPLARLVGQFPSYAVMVLDTNFARLFVFGLGRTLDEEAVESTKVSRTSVGGWAQMRYQRHVENYHLHHAKEAIVALQKVVDEEDVQYIILAGDEVIVPVLREQLPRKLADMVIEVLRLDITTPEHEILKHTADALRAYDEQSDRECVAELLDQYRGSGLAVVGVEGTMKALDAGQVDELIISATADRIVQKETGTAATASAASPTEGASKDQAYETVSDQLITKARQTGAKVRFIEDPLLLDSVEGVGAFLRYRVKHDRSQRED